MGSDSFEVEIINKKTIKPSSPTPHHLKTTKLSVFDQFASNVHVPILLFYPNINNTHSTDERSDILKTSLSNTLTQFYPFAGKFQYNHSIYCNDQGAVFLEAKVNCPISKVLDNPDLGMQIKQLAPSEAASTGFLVLVQANFFECGGLAIGASFSHTVADAYTANTFINSWAAIALASERVRVVPPAADFGAAASIFPSLDFLNTPQPALEYAIAKEKCTTRRFVFGASKIVALKARAASATVPNPTRVEAVSALIWKCAMEALRSNNSGFAKPSVWCQAVNMRKILARPLAGKTLFGSLVGLSITKTQATDHDLQSLVAALRKGVEDYKRSYGDGISGEDALKMYQEYGGLAMRDDVDSYSGSSLCRLPFYGADFGWGTPSWVFTTSVEHKNVVILMDTRDGEGIEALLTFKEEDMAVIGNDKELLAYAGLFQHKLRPEAKL